jgi:hypothetical protein
VSAWAAGHQPDSDRRPPRDYFHLRPQPAGATASATKHSSHGEDARESFALQGGRSDDGPTAPTSWALRWDASLSEGRRFFLRRLAGWRACFERDHRRWTSVGGVDDLGVVDAAETQRGNGKVRVPELTLNHEHRDTLARHLHRVRVMQRPGWDAPRSPPIRRPAAARSTPRARLACVRNGNIPRNGVARASAARSTVSSTRTVTGRSTPSTSCAKPMSSVTARTQCTVCDWSPLRVTRANPTRLSSGGATARRPGFDFGRLLAETFLRRTVTSTRVTRVSKFI